MIPALVAFPVLAPAGARIAGGAAGSAVGKGVSYVLNAFIRSDYWVERTKSGIYTAPEGHELLAEPTYKTSGQGRVKIINRNENSFEYEITAVQGLFTVTFITSEKWLHSANRDYEYRKSEFEYKEDLQRVIDQKLKEDEEKGSFDVI